MMAGGVFCTFLLLLVASHSDAEEKCLQIQLECGRHAVCGPIQSKYLQVCATTFATGRSCSKVCKSAHMQLLTNSIGSKYNYCDCETNRICSLWTANLLKACYGGVRPVIPKPTTPIPEVIATQPEVMTTEQATMATTPMNCLVLQQQCGADQTCGPLQTKYLQMCQRSLATGMYCTNDCIAAQMELMRNDIGSYYNNCDCGGNTICMTYGANLVKACYPPTDLPPMYMMTTEPPACPREQPSKMLVEKSPRNVRKLKMISVGTTILYKCKGGYDLVGDASRECLPNGQYSAELPRCVKSAGCKRQKVRRPLVETSSPRVRSNAKTMPVGTTLSYSCKKHYSLRGDMTRVCQQDGQYSAEMPQCEVSCMSHCTELKVSGGTVSVQLKKKLVIRESKKVKTVLRKICEAKVKCSAGLQQVTGPSKLYCGAGTERLGWVDNTNMMHSNELKCVLAPTATP